VRFLPARLGLHVKDCIHTRELTWSAEIRQRSSAIRPYLRSRLGAALLCRCEWLSYTEPSTNGRSSRRSARGRRNGSEVTAESWRGFISHGFLSLCLSEGL